MSKDAKIVADRDMDWLMEYEPQPDMSDHSDIHSAQGSDEDNPAPIPGLPLWSRQILVIHNYQITNSCFLDNKTALSRSQILVTGTPSSSSNKKLNHGYIRFVKKGELLAPQYDHVGGRISIFIDQDFMQATLAQLTHSRKYLWIGQFGNGHLYADIHSQP